MEKVPDRKAGEDLRLHQGWKYALGLEVDHPGFHYSSLCNFRGRLVESEAERIGFDAILTALRETGLVRKGKRQRLDSTFRQIEQILPLSSVIEEDALTIPFDALGRDRSRSVGSKNAQLHLQIIDTCQQFILRENNSQ